MTTDCDCIGCRRVLAEDAALREQMLAATERPTSKPQWFCADCQDFRPRAEPFTPCRTYWATHGCSRPRGHQAPHVCIDDYPDDGDRICSVMEPNQHHYGEDTDHG